MRGYGIAILLSLLVATAWTQIATDLPFELKVLDEKQAPLIGATVELLGSNSPSPLQMAVSDERGLINFTLKANTTYSLKIRYVGYTELITELKPETVATQKLSLNLQPDSKTLEGVTISGRKALIQRLQGKTIVNVDASVTNAGTTVLEVLEKSPGVMVDRNGGLRACLKNKV